MRLASKNIFLPVFFFFVVIFAAYAFFAAVSPDRASATPGPDAPANFSATAASACSATLSWNQPGSISPDYFEYRINASTTWNQIPGLSGLGNKSAVLSQFDPGGFSYKFYLHGCLNPAGSGNCSLPPDPSSSVTTPSLVAPPAPPSALAVTGWTGSGTNVTLSWTPAASPSYSGFRIYRSDNGGAFNPVGTIYLSDFAAHGNKWSDAVSTDVLHVYRVKTFQTDSGCRPVDNSTSENIATADWVKFYSGTLADFAVPARPAAVSVVTGSMKAGGTTVRFQWSASDRADSYRFQLASDQSFSAGVVVFDSTYGSSATATQDIQSLLPSKDYYYRVLACGGTGANARCSDYRTSASPYFSSYIPPVDLTTSLDFVNAKQIDVHLAWQDNAKLLYVHNTRIYKKLSSDANWPAAPLAELSPTCNQTACSYKESYVDSYKLSEKNQDVYDYKVVFYVTENNLNQETDPSNVAAADLKSIPIDSWGWASVDPGQGAGWIRMGWNSAQSAWGNSTLSGDANHYNVYVDGSGALHGSAWSGIPCKENRAPGATCGYGWLSFNESDANHPAPQIDPASGKVTGWVKFLSADPASGWDGWVNLRGSIKGGGGTGAVVDVEYGLCFGDVSDPNGYGTTCAGNGSAGNNKFSGWAWGGNVIGWIGFSNVSVPVSNAPVLKTPVKLPCVAADNCPVQLEWDNNATYTSLELHYSLPNADPNDPNYKQNAFYRLNYKPIEGQVLLQQGTGKTISTDQLGIKLNPKSLYGFFLRATQ